MNENVFSKQEAISIMQQGYRITHKWFTSDEWITMDDKGHIVFEDGHKCSLNVFFMSRTDDTWNDGYSIYTNQKEL